MEVCEEMFGRGFGVDAGTEDSGGRELIAVLQEAPAPSSGRGIDERLSREPLRQRVEVCVPERKFDHSFATIES